VGLVSRGCFGSGSGPGLPGSGSGRVTRIRIGFNLVLVFRVYNRKRVGFHKIG
jgi:hypothetical protein